MSASNVIASKQLKDIQVGDRIAYQAADLIEYDYRTDPYTPYTGEVLAIVYLVGKIQLSTPTGWLKPFPGHALFEVFGSDYDTAAQQLQYDVKKPEVFMGVSIE